MINHQKIVVVKSSIHHTIHPISWMILQTGWKVTSLTHPSGQEPLPVSGLGLGPSLGLSVCMSLLIDDERLSTSPSSACADGDAIEERNREYS